jgi:DNA processing protein
MAPERLWALLQVSGLGPATALRLARTEASWQRLVDAPVDVLASVKAGRVSPQALSALAASPPLPPEVPEARLVGFFDGDYPAGLRRIPNPPAVLWVRGTVPDGPLGAVVGTRHPTSGGEKWARRVSQRLVADGFGVVSGLAKGIDTSAHRTTLDAGGRTWAYLGSGVDRPSPAENRRLADEIVAAGGGLLAEVDPGTEPSPHTLVSRDRLQSGTSRFTVIVQSGIPSGTLHTARFTLEQGRPLVVVAPPGEEPDDPGWAANRALTDPEGCDPGILKASGRLAEQIAERRPAADLVLDEDTDLGLLATLG